MARVHEILGYEVIDTLGYGARSTIFAVRDRKGHIYALKRVVRQTERDERFIEQAILEHRIAKKLDHPVLRKSYKLIRSRQVIRVTEVYTLLEFVDGVTLEQSRPSSMLQLCQIFNHVAEGLGAMHTAGYVHADIKPNNIMVTEEKQVKIIDFGQSCATGSTKERIQGTPDYIAPEQVKRQHITPQTDIFNLGATLYWLTTSDHVPTMIPKGQAGVTLKTDRVARPPRDQNPAVPPALSSLIMSCIEKDPAKRPASMNHVSEWLSLAVGQLRRESSATDPMAQADNSPSAQTAG